MTERQYVRNQTSGQLGWLVQKDGKQWVKLDRPGEPNNVVPYRAQTWVPENPLPPLSQHGLAAVQFAADVAFCKAVGLFNLGRRRWEGLKDEQRIDWVKNGPDPERHPARARLYRAVAVALERLTDDRS